MDSQRLAILCALFGSALGSAAAQSRSGADLILHHGKVHDPATGLNHQAIAIRDGRIAATGTNAEIAARYRAAREIDLKGRFVIPGFNDTHIHLRGDAPHYVELSDARSIQEIKTRVAAKSKQLGKGAWVTGYGWSEDQLEEKRKPNRKDLDAAAPDNPVVLTRAGGHSTVANSRALAQARIDRRTPDPENGSIEHDETGEPSGIVRERNDLFYRFAPKASAEQLNASLQRKLKDLFAKGITSMIVAGVTVEEYAEWEKIYAQERDLPRAALQIRWTLPETLRAFGRKTGDGNNRLRVGAIKIFVDGGFTGPAAYTIEPYRDQGDYRGKLTMKEAELKQAFQKAHEMGWQLGLHTIGDGAIQLAVNALSEIVKASPRDNHRHYLNHFSMTPPEETYRKMKDAGVWLAQQPNFTYTLEGRYRDNLDAKRLELNNPVATPMKKYGIFTSLSSDILPIGPMVGLYAATTRKGMSGTVYGAQEKISMREAIQAYTQNGAYFTFEEKQKGTLAAGMLADLVVMPVDLLTTDPSRVLEASPDITILGGRVVFTKE
jgi:predicted amidohydrolase YtcJ